MTRTKQQSLAREIIGMIFFSSFIALSGTALAVFIAALIKKNDEIMVHAWWLIMAAIITYTILTFIWPIKSAKH